jgi:hypothetical protein
MESPPGSHALDDGMNALSLDEKYSKRLVMGLKPILSPSKYDPDLDLDQNTIQQHGVLCESQAWRVAMAEWRKYFRTRIEAHRQDMQVWLDDLQARRASMGVSPGYAYGLSLRTHNQGNEVH